MGYKHAVIEYKENNPAATGSEVAEAIGCSTDTVYRHWDAADPGAEQQPDDDHAEEELEGNSRSPDSNQTETEGTESSTDSQTQSEDRKEAEFDDSEAKEYTCGECDGDLDYLQKECDCGAQPAWSAIEGGA